MKFLSVCSGIEAASVAWHPLGWKAVAFSEIEPFPCAVLAHHYPDTPNYGDMTKYQEWPDHAIDLLCGGTPCQSFSVAGLRKGLADPRGNLMLTFGAIAAKYRPQWLVWENVPGVLSSNGGRDFGAFLGMLGELGYGVAYRVLDAQYFGVAQRRRRVFVVGCLGDWRSAAAVLFERHSLQGHPAPSREARKVAPTIPSRSTAGGGLGTDFDLDGGLLRVAPTLDQRAGRSGENSFATSGGLIETLCVATGQAGAEIGADMAPTLNCNHEAPYVAHSLRGEGFDASEDGTGRGTPLVPVCFDTTQITSAANYSNPKPGDPCHPLAAGMHAPAIAFSCKDHGADAGEVSPTLRAMGHGASHANAGGQVAIAFHPTQDPISSLDGSTHAMGCGSGGGQASIAIAIQGTLLNRSDTAGPAGSGINVDGISFTQTKNDVHAVSYGMQVRRLTATECERLQGFPDGYTAIPWRKKPASECPDGPRYKSLGNSWAVPNIRWIGQRIDMVQAIREQQREAA
jgi:DNA (cytosine-5)-methyltransferase 1